MRCAVVLFNRDLRIHDHPALAEAVALAETVVPLFVLDDAIVDGSFGAPNRLAFLHDSLVDLRASLRARGGDLVVRQGDPVDTVLEIVGSAGADAVFVSADVTTHARRREHRLADACAAEGLTFGRFPGVTVVPPGDISTGTGTDYKVFTPYWRVWDSHSWRSPLSPPTRVTLPTGIETGNIPVRDVLAGGACSPHLTEGGESIGRARLDAWIAAHLAHYDDIHDDLAADQTSRLSPFLHFGCLSPLEVATEARQLDGGAPFVRQLAWRDFHHQVTYHHPDVAWADLRPGRRTWIHDDDLVEAWEQGRTGYPIIDAAMRQLLDEGWMHNRARLLVASVLTKHWGIDWRVGAAHFERWLVDGDVANNAANWQWVAGTGCDTRPNRIFNPITQAKRFDPQGAYVTRYIPELETLEPAIVHEPWRLGPLERSLLDYPERVFDHELTAAAYRDGQ